MVPTITRPVIIRAAVVTMLLTSPLVIGMETAQKRGNTEREQFSTVDALLEEQPVGEGVAVTGTVTTPVENYTAESGNVYQEFRISDGTGELNVFCNTEKGRTRISQDETVTVSGTFKDFYGTFEIYAACADITG